MYKDLSQEEMVEIIKWCKLDGMNNERMAQYIDNQREEAKVRGVPVAYVHLDFVDNIRRMEGL